MDQRWTCASRCCKGSLSLSFILSSGTWRRCRNETHCALALAASRGAIRSGVRRRNSLAEATADAPIFRPRTSRWNSVPTGPVLETCQHEYRAKFACGICRNCDEPPATAGSCGAELPLRQLPRRAHARGRHGLVNVRWTNHSSVYCETARGGLHRGGHS